METDCFLSWYLLLLLLLQLISVLVISIIMAPTTSTLRITGTPHDKIPSPPSIHIYISILFGYPFNALVLIHQIILTLVSISINIYLYLLSSLAALGIEWVSMLTLITTS